MGLEVANEIDIFQAVSFSGSRLTSIPDSARVLSCPRSQPSRAVIGCGRKSCGQGNMKRIARSCVLAADLATCSFIASAQAPPKPLTHFSLAIYGTSEGVSVLCDEGCAWKTLRFTSGGTAVAFDERGLLSELAEKAAGAGGFVISVSDIGDKLELRCRSGCTWTVITSGPKHVVRRVDENGTIRSGPDRTFATTQSQSQPAASPASRFPSQWKWAAVGSTMRVRIVEGDRIDADNVMIPVPAERYSVGTFPPFGGVESAHLTRAGTMYAGGFVSAEVCFYTDGDHESQRRCSFQTAIEITLLTPTRIEGRAESGFGYDCRSCQITGKLRMKPFAWTPVK